jgi:alkylation response protein AidB-like acyl-CoA dehydrogenase
MTTTSASLDSTNDEERMIVEAVRELVSEKVAPRAAEIDETGEFPWDIKQLFAENDLLGIPIPNEYGGLGGTFVTYVKVVEEIAKACASSSLIVAVQELGMLPIMIAGSDEQKHRFLPRIASGEHIAAYALTEVSSGSDALGSMRTRAERRSDTYVLNGQKIWITNGSVADVICVFAVTDPQAGSRVRRGKRCARIFCRQKREKDGHTRFPHRRAIVRQLRNSGRELAGRRRRRVQDRDAGSR